MRKFLIAAAVAFFVIPAFAQDLPVTDVFMARNSQSFTPNSVQGYRLVEYLRTYGSWVAWDCGYIDFAETKIYRETFCAVGKTLHDTKRLTWLEELYFTQASGPDAHGARYLQPWTYVQVRFAGKFDAEAVYFPYLPLNSSGLFQHVLDRAKLEYHIGRNWKVGLGYAMSKAANQPRQDKPFFIVTQVTKQFGTVELWAPQLIPNGAQVQMRYTFAIKHGS
jgi:hypothetical protein